MPKFWWQHDGSSNQTMPLNPLPYQLITNFCNVQQNCWNGWKWQNIAEMARNGWEWLISYKKLTTAGNGWIWLKLLEWPYPTMSSNFQLIQPFPVNFSYFNNIVPFLAIPVTLCHFQRLKPFPDFSSHVSVSFTLWMSLKIWYIAIWWSVGMWQIAIWWSVGIWLYYNLNVFANMVLLQSGCQWEYGRILHLNPNFAVFFYTVG